MDKVFAICTVNNWKSENVMKKIGMCRKGEFNHPELTEFPEYNKCIWYEIKKE
jgi:RimJ/RimL family protein N-acetyltransferase